MTKKNNKSESDQHKRKLDKAYAKRQKDGTIGPYQMGGAAIGAALGTFGGPAGILLGGSLGSAAGNAVGYYTGTGDYKVSNNACMVPGYKGGDSTTISHREYITDVTSAATGTPSNFEISAYPLNPGVTRTFPWLATIASNYEEYEIIGMVFSFVATSGESVASANTSLGTVVMATEYDPTKPAFQNKQAMENYSFSTSAKPSVSQMHPIECKKVRTPVKQLYVRNGTNANDLRWTDFGNFYIATVGMQANNVNLGELWVTYKIKLLKPRLPITVGLGGQLATHHGFRTGVGNATGAGTASTFSQGPLQVIYTNTTISWAALPGMNYFFSGSYFGANWVSVTLTAAGATRSTYFNNFTQTGFNFVNVGSTAMTEVGVFTCTNTDTDGFITLTCAIGGIGGGSADFTIMQMDETIVV